MGQMVENIGRVVLVVEDDALLRMAALEIVEENGFAALEAENADDAITLLEKHPEIRIVFTDIHMAGSMDGLQLAAFAHDRWPPLRFIIVSGQHRPIMAEIPEGARFFSKPYDARAIGEALHAFL